MRPSVYLKSNRLPSSWLYASTSPPPQSSNILKFLYLIFHVALTSLMTLEPTPLIYTGKDTHQVHLFPSTPSFHRAIRSTQRTRPAKQIPPKSPADRNGALDQELLPHTSNRSDACVRLPVLCIIGSWIFFFSGSI